MTHEHDELAVGAPQRTEQMTDADAAKVTEIRTEIDETRLEMGGTLNELGSRLDPGQLINEAKDNVRDATIGRVEETARGISDMVTDTIKQNPIPAAMAGAGIALLWMNRSQGNTRYRGHSYAAPYGGRQEAGVGDRFGDAASTVGDAVGGATDRVGHAVGRAGENVGQNVGETMGQIGSQLGRIMQANPLAMAAVAAGTGAILGTLAPAIPKERELVGDASRQVGIAVRDAVDEAASEAEKALDETEAKVNARS